MRETLGSPWPISVEPWSTEGKSGWRGEAWSCSPSHFLKYLFSDELDLGVWEKMNDRQIFYLRNSVYCGVINRNRAP